MDEFGGVFLLTLFLLTFFFAYLCLPLLTFSSMSDVMDQISKQRLISCVC